jgi:tetratricopeptide (TPR) repeat protein
LHRWILQLVALTAGGALLSGCGTLSKSPAKGRSFAAPGRHELLSEPEPAAARTASAHAHYGAGVICEMNGDLDGALAEYRQAALHDPTDEWLVLEVSRRLLQNKQSEPALEVLARAAEAPDVSGAVLGRLGMVYSQLGKTEKALAASREAIKKAPAALAGYQTLFVHFLQTQKPLEALAVLDEASQQKKAPAEFFLGLAELYVTLGLQAPAQRETAHTRAMTALERVDKLEPTLPGLRLKLADTYNLLGEPDKAARVYLELLKKLPDFPGLRESIHAKLAEIYLRGSDPQKAFEQLEALIRNDPTNPQAYYFLGSLAWDAKKGDAAADYFAKALVLNPNLEPAYYDLAMVQISLDKPAAALATLEQARAKFPPGFLLEFWTALAHTTEKNYTNAVRHFTAAEVIGKATETNRLNGLFYFQFGAACERVGRYEEAEKYFAKSLDLSPNFHEAMNYLGYMWAERGVNLEKARQLIEKAVQGEPKNAAFLDSLAWVLFQLAQPQAALEQIQKAVSLLEEPDATVFDHLGDIYLALGEKAKAREAWTRSVAIEPSDKVKRKLEDGIPPGETSSPATNTPPASPP